jgi:adenylate cyclase
MFAITAVAAFVIVVVAVLVFRSGGEAEDPILAMPTGPTIAVLPFENMSGDPEQEYFSDGITEDIITELARFRNLHVVARNSSFRYKGKSVDVRKVGQELGANYIVEGSVRKAGERVRITAQLVDAGDGSHLWAETYDRDLLVGNIFDIQDDITRRVVGKIAGSHGVLTRTIVEKRKRGTFSLDAYECVLNGYAYERILSREMHRKVRSCLEQTLEIEPDYADAWSMLAQMYLDEFFYGYNPHSDGSDPLERMESAALRSIELDPTNQQGHMELAIVYFLQEQLDKFLIQAEKAISLNPNNEHLLAAMGVYITYTGNFDRGVALTKKAILLNPDHPGWFHVPLYLDHYRKGEYEAALARIELMKMPKFHLTHILLAAVYGKMGRMVEAQNAVEDLIELRPDFAETGKLREEMEKRLKSIDLLNDVLDGLRKAGLNIPYESAVAG